MRLKPSAINLSLLLTATLALINLTPAPAYAFYTIQETGDILKESETQFATELQFVTNGDEGANILVRLDKGFDPDSNLRFVAGGGTTDFIVGAFYKWVPYPDYDKQPAIGFTFGAHIARFNNENDTSGRVIPFISKKYEVVYGLLTPYASLPFGFSSYNDETTNPVQLILGSRYKHSDFEHCEFNLEFGFDIDDAPSFISLGAIFPAF